MERFSSMDHCLLFCSWDSQDFLCINYITVHYMFRISALFCLWQMPFSIFTQIIITKKYACIHIYSAKPMHITESWNQRVYSYRCREFCVMSGLFYETQQSLCSLELIMRWASNVSRSVLTWHLLHNFQPLLFHTMCVTIVTINMIGTLVTIIMLK